MTKKKAQKTPTQRRQEMVRKIAMMRASSLRKERQAKKKHTEAMTRKNRKKHEAFDVARQVAEHMALGQKSKSLFRKAKASKHWKHVRDVLNTYERNVSMQLRALVQLEKEALREHQKAVQERVKIEGEIGEMLKAK